MLSKRLSFSNSLKSGYCFVTSTPTGSSTTLQTSSTKMTLNGNGLLSLSGAMATGYIIKSVNYTLTTSNKTVEVTSPSTQTLLTAVGNNGLELRIINASASNITVATTSSQTIGNKVTGNPITITLLPEEWLDVISNGSNWRII